MDLDEAARAFREFVAVIKALRTPGSGCPWDLEQDHHTLRPYLLEEAHEVLDAIDRGDDPGFRDELGDLLLQVVLHAQVAADRGAFSITEVVRGIAAKMVRRHPHVFGSVSVRGSDEVRRNWEQIKATEVRDRGGEASHGAALDRVPENLPALLRAQRLGEKAAKSHFDAPSAAAALGKAREHFAALEELLRTTAVGGTPREGTRGWSDELRGRLEHELGDVLFSLCQLARWLGLSAEDSLRVRTQQFVARFRRMEQQAPRPLHELSPDELKTAWQQAAGAEEPSAYPP
jgi:MazG family protein